MAKSRLKGVEGFNLEHCIRLSYGGWVGLGICQIVFGNYTMVILLAVHIQRDDLM